MIELAVGVVSILQNAGLIVPVGLRSLIASQPMPAHLENGMVLV